MVRKSDTTCIKSTRNNQNIQKIGLCRVDNKMQNSVNLSEMTETEIQVQKPTEIETEFTNAGQKEKTREWARGDERREILEKPKKGPKKGCGAVRGSEPRTGKVIG